MKRLMMALAGAVLAIASMQVSAEAATINLGDITNSSNDGFGGAFAFFVPTAVSDQVAFHISTDSYISGNLVNLPFSVTLPHFGTFDILNITGLGASYNSTVLTLDASGNFTIASALAAGDYLIDISGLTSGILGGAYHIALTATQAPIPGALLLFLTALGGMGFAGLRRRRSAAA